jgi:hypothetical protein
MINVSEFCPMNWLKCGESVRLIGAEALGRLARTAEAANSRIKAKHRMFLLEF